MKLSRYDQNVKYLGVFIWRSQQKGIMDKGDSGYVWWVAFVP